MSMAVPQPAPRYTIDEYLAKERTSHERHIYLDGEMIAMAGEKLPHGYISTNVIGLLHPQLRGTPCGVLTKDTKVRSGRTPMSGKSMSGFFSYPDVLVVCGDPEFHDAYKDIILNPTTIVEVLSDSTEAFDRGVKFRRYRKWNPTLRDYLLISQDMPAIDHFSRSAEGVWSIQSHEGLEGEIVISSIRCVLKIADVYDRVVFSEGPPGLEGSD